jgi:hypothetical protein
MTRFDGSPVAHFPLARHDGYERDRPRLDSQGISFSPEIYRSLIGLIGRARA